jgi:hypothetical protein
MFLRNLLLPSSVLNVETAGLFEDVLTARFEVVRVVLLKMQAFWGVTPCY